MAVREVHEILSADRQIAPTTVLTTLQRLTRKGLVEQLTEEKPQQYRALATRGEMFAELLTDALGVLDGEPGAFVRFIDELDPENRTALRRALDGEARNSPANGEFTDM
ncbi:hypothetical protein HerbRD11066_13980 [Herbidospora sp. RD11066]